VGSPATVSMTKRARTFLICDFRREKVACEVTPLTKGPFADALLLNFRCREPLECFRLRCEHILEELTSALFRM
jgi:hypothetical protein